MTAIKYRTADVDGFYHGTAEAQVDAPSTLNAHRKSQPAL